MTLARKSILIIGAPKGLGRKLALKVANKKVFDGGLLYCSSKFAQDYFSAAVSKEVREDKIKVSVLCSNLVDYQFHPALYDTNKLDD